MADYLISGIWKDSEGTITHYAIHKTATKRARKYTKAEAVELLEKESNSATTWLWNYDKKNWDLGEEVTVVEIKKEKFLRTKHNDKTIDNLAQLIDYDWLLNS